MQPAKSPDEMDEAELGAAMTAAIKAATAVLPHGTLVVMVAAPFGGPGIGQYISNGRRSDVIRFMKETAERLESREDVRR